MEPTNEPDFVITLEHVRGLRVGGQSLCISGMREWAGKNGIDWRAFTRDGIPASRLLETNDALAARLVGVARANHERSLRDGQEK